MTACKYAFNLLRLAPNYGGILEGARIISEIKAGQSIILPIIKGGLKQTFGAIFISAGVGRGLLKITETKDTKLGQAISQILFYLEIAALLGEIGIGLIGFIRKIAKNALKLTDEISAIRNEVDELTIRDTNEAGVLNKSDDLIAAEEKLAAIAKLEEIAGQESKRILKKYGLRQIEYEILPENLSRKYIDEAVEIFEKEGVTLKIKFIDELHPSFNSDLLGRFGVSPTNKKNVVLELRQPCPKITWHHERWHMDDFLTMGWSRYRKIQKETPWLHEESVWNNVLKNRNKWQERELADAYGYYKWYCNDRFGVPHTVNKEMEELLIKYTTK